VFKLGMTLGVLLACVMLLGAGPADPVVTLDSRNGSIRVGVLDGNGKAVVGVQVRLFHAKEKKKRPSRPPRLVASAAMQFAGAVLDGQSPRAQRAMAGLISFRTFPPATTWWLQEPPGERLRDVRQPR
jgi:hypothetical protein